MLLLKEYIHELLIEKRRTEKEGIKTNRGYEELKKHIGENVFIHFSNVDKLGLFPGSTFNTPVGIYGYPLTLGVFEMLERAEIPFAQERLYIHVFAPRNPDKILNTLYYWEDKLQDDIGRLEKMFPNVSYTEMSDWIKKAKVRTAAGEIWNITRMLSFARGNIDREKAPANQTSAPMSWTRILLDLGYEGIVDKSGIIHSNEPLQGVFFGADKINHITTILNPLVTRGKLRIDELENLLGSINDSSSLYSLLLFLLKKQKKEPLLQNQTRQVITRQMRILPDEVLIKMWNNKNFAWLENDILERIRKPNEEMAIEILNRLLDRTILGGAATITGHAASIENILKPINKQDKERVYNRLIRRHHARRLGEDPGGSETEKRILRALLDDKSFIDKEKEEKILDVLGYKSKNDKGSRYRDPGEIA